MTACKHAVEQTGYGGAQAAGSVTVQFDRTSHLCQTAQAAAWAGLRQGLFISGYTIPGAHNFH
jgi:hypothetical protein